MEVAFHFSQAFSDPPAWSVQSPRATTSHSQPPLINHEEPHDRFSTISHNSSGYLPPPPISVQTTSVNLDLLKLMRDDEDDLFGEEMDAETVSSFF